MDAVVPLAMGLADSIGVQHAFPLPTLFYLFILYYGLCGSRATSAPTVR